MYSTEGVEYRPPPFTIDRSMSGTLEDQLAAALVKAVETGYYGPGDMLPPTRDLARILGVSRVVAIRAMRRLAEQRLIVQRPHYGSVVCAKDRPLWKGQVLLVATPGIGNADDDPIRIILRDTLIAEGHLPIVATVPRSAGGVPCFAFLDTVMRQQIDLVVLLDNKKDVAQWLSRRGVPFVWLGNAASHPKNCLGIIRIRNDLALGDFVAHCREAGVGDVLQVKVWRNGLDVAPALARIGVRVETLTVPGPEDGWKGYGLANWAASEFCRRASSLPELVFFQDDHLATGALLALGDAGVKIPRDVRIVTWANKDYGPVSLVPLTRMEMDCETSGSIVSASVLECLRTGKVLPDAVIGPRYVRGESF